MVSRMQRSSLQCGQHAFREGDPADRFFLLAGGEVQVEGRDGRPLARLSDGGCFGEMEPERGKLGLRGSGPLPGVYAVCVAGEVRLIERSRPPAGVCARIRDAERTSVREKERLSTHAFSLFTRFVIA